MKRLKPKKQKNLRLRKEEVSSRKGRGSSLGGDKVRMPPFYVPNDLKEALDIYRERCFKLTRERITGASILRTALYQFLKEENKRLDLAASGNLHAKRRK